MDATGRVRLTTLLALLALAAGCTATHRVDMDVETLRDELRSGGLVEVGDRVTVVTTVQGSLTFEVTDVDAESIRGDSVEVPIDEVVTMEQRKIAPLRTVGAVYGGMFLVGMILGSVSIILAILL